MPLPTPQPNEGHDDFIERCMSELSEEYPEEAQRMAICQTQWDEDKDNLVKFVPGSMKNLPKKKAWEIKAAEKNAEIYLYDEIGGMFGENTAKGFAEDMKRIKDVSAIDIYINSPGGNVFDGVAIYNQLRRHKAVKRVHVDGIAASIASVIAMAGDEIEMAANAMMMIHDPWTGVMGNADELEKAADTLRRIQVVIQDTYVARTGQKAEDVAAMMAEETWFGAEDAVDMGFADSITESVDMAACAKFDFSNFKHPPNLQKTEAPKNPDEPFTPKRHPAVVSVEARLIKHGIGVKPDK